MLCMRSASERRRYIVTSSLIGWAHTKKWPLLLFWMSWYGKHESGWISGLWSGIIYRLALVRCVGSTWEKTLNPFHDDVMTWELFPLTDPLWGETTSEWPVDSPHKGPVIYIFDVFFSSNLYKLFDLSMIWDTMALMWGHYNGVLKYTPKTVRRHRATLSSPTAPPVVILCKMTTSKMKISSKWYFRFSGKNAVVSDVISELRSNRALSQIPKMHVFHIPQCSIQNRNVHISVLTAEMCTFLFWLEHCGVWSRCILGVVN